MGRMSTLKNIFPACAAGLPDEFWHRLEEQTTACSPELFPEQVREYVEATGGSAYLFDLARIELADRRIRQAQPPVSGSAPRLEINPALTLLEVGWHPLLPLLEGKSAAPDKSPQILMLWRHPVTEETHRSVAGSRDLLALKVVAEGLDPEAVASEAGRPVGTVDAALQQAVDRGLLIAPPSRIRRVEGEFPRPAEIPEKFARAEVFTLQWHITQRCDLHCRHCYDRSSRGDVAFAQGVDILGQLRRFCRDRHVRGQVSFSGGNPVLHPDFLRLYQAARDRNFTLAILGNPVAEAQLDAILEIAPPAFYQVSLEGLTEHNDTIRGEGNFAAVLDFLDLLRRRNVYSMVMLTLTRRNMGQVLELAETLRGRTDLFTYNRLSMVGEGAGLESPRRDEYRAFVQDYLRAKKDNPTMALKGSLLNIEREGSGEALFGGCTGFGCGAAFNFVSLLADGEVHACRKFPSPIGNLQHQSLDEIYTGEAARAYRRGCRECDACRLRHVCGGCLAVAYGWGADPLEEKDPACFLARETS